MIVLSSVASGQQQPTCRFSFEQPNASIPDSIGLQLALNRYNQYWSKTPASSSNRYLVYIDFSQPSTQNRLYLLDMSTCEVELTTLVAHGKNTGENKAKKFSNKPGSYQSSLGLYKTGKPYSGQHGYSLKLHGLDKGVNNAALDRAIVVHGADYVSKKFIQKYGRLGRSFGCPAVPVELARPLIDKIKNGTLMYIYHPSMHQH